ncbi:MAG: serine hydrolase domain-containing protein, partial [Gemmatimonadales bacterium]
MTSARIRSLTVWLVLSVSVSASVLAQGLPRAAPQDVGMSPERLERLSQVFQQYVTDDKLAGAVALVARHGKVAYLETFGFRDLESEAPMPEDAIFRIASQSKAIVSVGVMVLQEEGRLLITDPVGKYLPEFRHTTVAVPREDG